MLIYYPAPIPNSQIVSMNLRLDTPRVFQVYYHIISPTDRNLSFQFFSFSILTVPIFSPEP